MNDGEKKVVARMIKMYCQSKHGVSQILCAECAALQSYAEERLESCPFGEKKPTCGACPIHCYKTEMRLRIKAVMRFVGSRMLFFYPVDTMVHFYKEYVRNKYFRSTFRKKQNA